LVLDSSSPRRRAVAWYALLSVTIERVMTDNAFACAQRSYAGVIAALGLRHLRTRPYKPRTNGKAERFIQTALRQWAYAKHTVRHATVLARSPPFLQATSLHDLTRLTAGDRRSLAYNREQALRHRHLERRVDADF
jgi:transposase InsO family protein